MKRSIRRADLAVAVVLVLLFSGYTLAQFDRAREVADRVKCASNLRQIGMALLLYSNDNRGAFPRTLADLEKPTPTWGTPYRDDPKLGAEAKADPFDAKNSKVCPAPNDVTAAMFMLLRTQDITSEVFICPSTGQEKWDYGGGTNTPINWTNWPGVEALRDHLSYSYQNPYPTKDAIAKGWKLNNSISAEYAVAADLNPGNEALLKITVNSSQKEMMAGNSPNHNRDGENVLYGDGHVEFVTTPLVGVKRDNIYTYGDSGTDAKKSGDGIVGPTVGPDDSVLLPTALDLGIVDKQGRLTPAATAMLDRRLGREPPPPQELLAAANKVMGRYVRDDAKAGGLLKLDIAKDKITLTRGGGRTTAYDWHIAGLTPDGGVRLSVSLPDALQSETLAAWPDGNVMFIAGNAELAGRWSKQP
jgi:hypothetical protein